MVELSRTTNRADIDQITKGAAFDGRVPATGRELWKSDGTTGGTALVKDLFPGSLPASIEDLTSVGGFLYFGGRWDGNGAGTGDFELWKSDGTSGGTAVLKDIAPGTTGSFPSKFGSVAGTVLFTANDGTNGEELWTTDGTAGGTVMLKDINTSGSGASSVNGFFQLGGWAYFVGNDGTNGAELWRTDGTSGNTSMFADLRPGSSWSLPSDFAVVGSNLLFSAEDDTHYRELWATDGSTLSFLKDINPHYSSDPQSFFATGTANQAYFSAYDGNASGLWKTDGTSAGTTEVAELGASPGNFAKFGPATIVFTANVGISGDELWTFADGDCGDAPDPVAATAGEYPTLLADGGACHAATGATLGASRDVDADGQPTSSADGDDLDGDDDEDGVTFTSAFNIANVATFDVTLSASASLNVWIDWNGNGSWDDLGDHAVFSKSLGAGTHNLAVTVPTSASVGTTYARFRVDSIGTPLARGIVFDGEVEDYQITIGDMLDFGDAPDPLIATAGEYPTLLANDGAGHRIVPGVHLGSGVDAESDGQPTASADGDDADGNDDDDGVVFTTALLQNANASVDVTVSTPGYVSAWIDFDRDGVWAEGGNEEIIDEVHMTAGTHPISFAVPAGAPSGATYARFRFDTNSDGYQPLGLAADGESRTTRSSSAPRRPSQMPETITPSRRTTSRSDWAGFPPRPAARLPTATPGRYRPARPERTTPWRRRWMPTRRLPG